MRASHLSLGHDIWVRRLPNMVSLDRRHAASLMCAGDCPWPSHHKIMLCWGAGELGLFVRLCDECPKAATCRVFVCLFRTHSSGRSLRFRSRTHHCLSQGWPTPETVVVLVAPAGSFNFSLGCIVPQWRSALVSPRASPASLWRNT